MALSRRSLMVSGLGILTLGVRPAMSLAPPWTPVLKPIVSFSIARKPGRILQSDATPDFLERLDMRLNYLGEGKDIETGVIKWTRYFPTKTGGWTSSVLERPVTSSQIIEFKSLSREAILKRGIYTFYPQAQSKDADFGLAWVGINLQQDGKPTPEFGFFGRSYEWRAPLVNRSVIEPLWIETMRIAREALGLEGFMYLGDF